MKRDIITKLHKKLQTHVQVEPGTDTPFGLARDLQLLLGDSHWDNFLDAKQTKESCKTTALSPQAIFVTPRKWSLSVLKSELQTYLSSNPERVYNMLAKLTNKGARC